MFYLIRNISVNINSLEEINFNKINEIIEIKKKLEASPSGGIKYAISVNNKQNQFLLDNHLKETLQLNKENLSKNLGKNLIVYGISHFKLGGNGEDDVRQINNKINEQIKLMKLLNEGKIDDYLNEAFNLRYIDVSEPMDKAKLINIYKRIKINNQIKRINANVGYSEGKFLYNIVSNNKPKKTLEVGFANGISALYILMGYEDTNLISVDPFQTTQWKSNGVNLMKEFNFSSRHRLIEKKNYVALPEILKHNENTYDFIFIDGWHTFDYTLLDFFYADLLLKIGGIIVIDDALHKGVAKCVKYINTNYKHFKRINSPKTFAAYKKISNDKRDWDFHKEF